MFRDHGEKYITIYQPSAQQIKLIRSIRVCRTPALGGRRLDCNQCGTSYYIYNSCGNSQCMICQSIKREQWIDKLKCKLLKVPYCHVIFTLPHQLNGLAKANQSLIYNMIMKVSWMTIRTVSKDINYLGALPGMISVLHTFGSACNYHIHVHALVTFGGMATDEKWQQPTNNKRIAPYRQMCKTFKDLFLKELTKEYENGDVHYHLPFNEIIDDLKNKRWVVHSTRPSMDTGLIENYLARYINRIAVSQSRINYVKQTKEVHILYNDYKNQAPNQPAPKAIKALNPIVAIDQIIQHTLPPRFQKSRSYGIHHASNKLKLKIEENYKRNGDTIRTVMEIITHLMGLEKMKCEKCGSENFKIVEIKSDKNYITTYLESLQMRGPPIREELNAELQEPSLSIIDQFNSSNGILMSNMKGKYEKLQIL